MNNIIINDNEIEQLDIDKNLIVTINNKENPDILKINIEIINDTNLNINFKGKNYNKIDVELTINKNVQFVLNEIKEEENIKVQNKYYLEENSKAVINKFYDVSLVKELNIIYLNDKNSQIDYNFKTICKDQAKYDIVVYHQDSTKCNINNKGITTLEGNLIFNVTGIIYNKMKNCEINQNNRIINMNDGNCEINPNLLIEENEVIANHSAYIGKFKSNELFYLMSRGLSEEESTNLLIKGFLKDNNEKVNKIIDKYWR